MLGLLLAAFLILSMVSSIPLDTSRYLIDSQPLLFVEDADADSQVVNSTLVLKKKNYSGGPVYYNDQKEDGNINNHHLDSEEAAVWRFPQKPVSDALSNHKGGIYWDRNRFQKITTKIPFQLKGVISNHNPASPVRNRPQQASSLVSVIENLATAPPTDILGDRLKLPDTIKSTAIKVLNAPSNVRTTIKHKNIIVIQKRTDPLLSNFIDKDQQATTMTTFKPTKVPDRGNFSVAAVMDQWSHVPIPSSPSWAQSSSPVKGGISRPVAAQTVVPNIPFMPFLSSLITPLLNKPLTSSAVNSGMQGIKAMQGFLRNSLMGAMFCFLPSAFIALSLTTTQRAQLRKIPEIDDMMFFCKKCLENLKDIKELQNSKELNWLKENLD